ncbi:MAG: hypothetical protein IJ695_02965 [Butyrivibrio sp.]|nr:hypothetical protein [Butyrivibrio sp.]
MKKYDFLNLCSGMYGRMIAVAVAAALIVGTAGCGGQAQDKTTQSDATAQDGTAQSVNGTADGAAQSVNGTADGTVQSENGTADGSVQSGVGVSDGTDNAKGVSSKAPSDSSAKTGEVTSDDSAKAGGETGSAKDESQKPFSATRIKYKAQTEDTIIDKNNNKSIPFAYVTYEKFEMSDEMQKLYPKLSEALKTRSGWNEEDALKILAEQVHDYRLSDDEFEWMYNSNYFEKSTMVQRSDERVFSVLVDVNTYFNGPHPFNYWEAYTYETQTGEQIPLSDVVSDIRALPQLLLDNLRPIDETYEFSDEQKSDMLAKIEQYVADNDICWVLTSEAFAVFFNAYELQSYAFGPIFVSLTYKDFPDLLLPQYRPMDNGSSEIDSELFPAENAGSRSYSWSDLEQYYEPPYESTAYTGG